MEISINNLVGVFEEADSFTVRTVDLRLTNIDYFSVLEKLRSVKGRFHAQDQRRAVFDH